MTCKVAKAPKLHFVSIVTGRGSLGALATLHGTTFLDGHYRHHLDTEMTHVSKTAMGTTRSVIH